jgi:hypothetical protein
MLTLTLYSKVILKKLPDAQEVKKFPGFYETREFVAASTTDGQWNVS